MMHHIFSRIWSLDRVAATGLALSLTPEIPICLPPSRDPRRPAIRFPPGSIDTHVHVFDSRFPLIADRGYTPPDSTVEDLRRLHATIGIDRVVLTQPSVYGTDNRAILDAADLFNAETPDRARAVVAVGLDVSDDELEALHGRGVRGVRLNTDNAGGMPIDWSDVPRLGDRIRPLGWHAEFLFPGDDLGELLPIFQSLTVPMSIAHFAYQPAAAGVEADGFRALLELLRGGNTWLKISGADRVSSSGPPRYDECRTPRRCGPRSFPRPGDVGDRLAPSEQVRADPRRR